MHMFIKQQFAKIGLKFTLLLFIGFIAGGFDFPSSSLSLKEEDFSTTNVISQLNNIPLSFEKNEGQTDPSVQYFTRGWSYTFYFTHQDIVMVLQKPLKENEPHTSSVLKIQFAGAQTDSLVTGIKELEYKSHYFIGNNPAKWLSSIPHYAHISYQNLYPGIDITFYGNPQQLEYDIFVAPGSNPQDIQLQIEGAQEIFIDKEGNLHLMTEDQYDMQMLKPIVYQMEGKNKVFIEGKFVLLAPDKVGFALGAYDKNKVLIIDPILSYSTYLGGTGTDLGTSIAVDSNGNAYITGQTFSADFPITTGAFQPSFQGASDAFVTKLNATGSALIYSTYLGGSSADTGNGIAVDSSGNAYITGQTNSTDFPVTIGAFQPTLRSFVDAFVTKLSATGSALIYSTYLGGSSADTGNGIAVDSNGNAYITGVTLSANFPVTTGAFQTVFQGPNKAFVTKFNATGSALIYSTYLGGSNADTGNGIAVDSSGNAYITGFTVSSNFPTTIGAFQTTLLGTADAFVTKLNATGSTPIYSTYLGGSGGDTGNGIAVDSNGNAYITGQTFSADFPTTIGAFQTTLLGTADAFVTKLNAIGSALVYSTYLGGSSSDQGNGIALDSNGNAYVTGFTQSTNFPTTIGAFQPNFQGVTDAFVTKLNATGSAPIYSTYLGGSSSDQGNGIAVDNNGNAYVTGQTFSADFPTTIGAFQPNLKGIADAFVTKFAIGNPIVISINPNQGPITGGTVVTITGTNFTGTTAVNFGSNAAIFVVNSDTQITAISPPGVGTVDVTVTTPFGTSSISPADQFTYIRIATTITLTVSPNPATFGQPVTLTATVAPPTATGTVTFFDGSTAIGTVPLVNGTAILVTSSLSVGTHLLIAVYSGDSNFLPATSSPVVLTVNGALPPIHLKGFQKENRFATQTDLINIITWKAPIGGTPIVSYKIYRDANLTKLIAVVPNHHHTLKFKEHNRKEEKTYSYFIVSVDQFGNISSPATVIIRR